MIKPPWKSSIQKVFVVLGKPRCLAILALLLEHPRTRGELAGALGCPLGKVDNDLFKLRHAGLLQRTQPGVRNALCRLRCVTLDEAGSLHIQADGVSLTLRPT